MRNSTLRWLTASTAIMVALEVQAQTALSADSCNKLVGTMPASVIGIPSGVVKITSATSESARPLAVAERGPSPAARVQPATPDFCKVLGEIAPIDPKAPPINFQINLPKSWNGKAVQYGGGGFNGMLITGLALVPASHYDKPAPLSQGYVTYGTDSGHLTKPGEAPQLFAANDEAFVNFAHAAYKKVRDVAVAVSEKAYGSKPRRVYFVGSSEGGREALTMAQRYPKDFDGVFARVPVINWVGLMHSSYRSGLVTMGDGWLNPAHVKLTHDATLRTCDADDGASDSLIANSRRCLRTFKVESLKCKSGQAADTCLNERQIKAVQTLRSPYRFPFALANGLDDYPGWGIGGEALPASGPTGGWSAWWTGTVTPTWPVQPGAAISWGFGAGAMAHIFARDPSLDVKAYRPEDHKARIKEVSRLMDSTNPDINRFRSRGGKVLMLEYMSDYAQSPYAGIRYYENVVRTLGVAKAADTIRLFTAPGVDHVGTGAPAQVDMLAALDNWVEQGKAPVKLTVVEQDVASPVFATKRALPLCEWPMWPRHKSGDTTRADNYECVR
jgi:hypothetical protein